MTGFSAVAKPLPYKQVYPEESQQTIRVLAVLCY